MLRSVFVIGIAAALAQGPPKLEFEVVSIKPSPDPEPGRPVNVGCHGGPGTADPAMFRCTNMNLANLISTAYSILRYQLSGPDWMQGQRFDVAAKVPEGTSKEQANVMLQNMLVGRFKLSVHHETKDAPKYDLVVAKGGAKLKESIEDLPLPSAGPPDGSPPKADKDMYPILPAGRAGTIIMNGRARMFRPNTTMQQFAQTLSAQRDKPVTDATGLTGKFDISLYWAADSLRAAPGAEPPPGDPGPTLEQAIQDQLGLRLVSTKGPVDFILVDHLEKLPTGN